MKKEETSDYRGNFKKRIKEQQNQNKIEMKNKETRIVILRMFEA